MLKNIDITNYLKHSNRNKPREGAPGFPSCHVVCIFKNYQPLRRVWWHTLLTSTLERQRQVNICVFQASLIFIGSLRPVKAA